MAGRTVKTAKAAKPRAASATKTRTKASAKPKAAVKAKAPVKKTPVKKISAKKIASKKVSAKRATAKKAVVKKALVKKTSARVKATVKAKAPTKKNQTKKLQAPKTSVKNAAVRKSAVKTGSRIKAVDKVVAAARTVKKTMPSQVSPADVKILSELADLAKYIRDAKREIAAIRPDDVKDQYLPKAADELDAVVEATADATNSIMDACEVVEAVMGDVSPEISAKLMDVTTRIYEACTFQDITGQRIGKVVTTMKHIEECIDALIGAFGKKGRGAKKQTAPHQPSAPKQREGKNVTDTDLLEGPQLGANAKSQAEIDDLFANFD